MPAPDPPTFPRPDDAAAFGEALRRAGYTLTGVCGALGVPRLEALDTTPFPVLLARTARGRPIDTLIRLIILGIPVPATQVAEATRPVSVESLAAAGFVRAQGDHCVAMLAVTPHESVMVLHDRPAVRAAHADYVMGIGATTRSVAQMIVPRRVASVLDLGCGGGVLSMLASPLAERVTGTDINPRALHLATLSAAINAVPNAEFLQGNLFEPVQGRRFDLVLSNPPLVIKPPGPMMYRDSGAPADTFARTIVERAGDVLEPGGIMQIVCNYAHVGATPPRDRVASWVATTGCDALVLTRKTWLPIEYAASWIQESEPGTPDTMTQALQRWLDSFAQQDIQAVSEAVIVLQRPRSARANWFAFETIPESPPLGSAGAHMLRMIEGRSMLAEVGPDGDQRLLGMRLAPSPDARIETQLAPGAAEWARAKTELTLAQGYQLSRPIDGASEHLLTAVDGARTLREAVEHAARTTGQTTAALTTLALRLARQLLERGMLVSR